MILLSKPSTYYITWCFVKSIAITLANSTIFQDVPYKPEELYVKTRKCQPDADAKVVQICERQAICFFFFLDISFLYDFTMFGL